MCCDCVKSLFWPTSSTTPSHLAHQDPLTVSSDTAAKKVRDLECHKQLATFRTDQAPITLAMITDTTFEESFSTPRGSTSSTHSSPSLKIMTEHNTFSGGETPPPLTTFVEGYTET